MSSADRKEEKDSELKTTATRDNQCDGSDESNESSDEKLRQFLNVKKASRRIYSILCSESGGGDRITWTSSKQQQPSKMLNSDTFDTEEADFEHETESDGKQSVNEPSTSKGRKKLKKTKKKEETCQKKGMKTAELKALHSKSQRMFRRTEVKIPYTEPPQMTFAEFKEHRKRTALPVPPVMKPSAAQYNAWLDSLEAAKNRDSAGSANTSRTEADAPDQNTGKSSRLSLKEKIRKVKADALRSGYVPKLTSDTETLVFLDNVVPEGVEEFRKKLDRQMRKPVPQPKDPKDTRELIFDEEKGPKLDQLKTFLQVGIFKDKEERFAKKIAEFNRRNNKSWKKVVKSDEEANAEDEDNESNEKLDATQEKIRDEVEEEEKDNAGSICDEESEIDENKKNYLNRSCAVDSEIELPSDSEDIMKNLAIDEKCRAKLPPVCEDNSSGSFEIIGSMIAPYQRRREKEHDSQKNPDSDSESPVIDVYGVSEESHAGSLLSEPDCLQSQVNKESDLQSEDEASELLGLCSGKFTGGNFNSDDATSQETQNELLMLCSGKFPQSQVENDFVNLVSDSDDSIVSCITGPRRKVAQTILDSSDLVSKASDSESDFICASSPRNVDESDEVKNVSADDEDSCDTKSVSGKPRVRQREFLEDEAELSGSGVSSDEEDDEDDDFLEEELGDNEELGCEEELHNQVSRIHWKAMLDEDKNNLRLLQEHFLEDGDLDGGPERPRQFRWKTEGNDFVETEQRSEIASEDSNDDEDDGQWRKEMYEREKWIAERRLAEEEEQQAKCDALLMKRKMAAASETVAGSLESRLPKLLTKPSTSVLCGSFRHRDKEVLKRIAKFRPGLQNMANSRRQVFARVSPKKDSGKNAPVHKSKSAKRAAEAASSASSANKHPKLDKPCSDSKGKSARDSLFSYL